MMIWPGMRTRVSMGFSRDRFSCVCHLVSVRQLPESTVSRHGSGNPLTTIGSIGSLVRYTCLGERTMCDDILILEPSAGEDIV
jgi:hypothetical protein